MNLQERDEQLARDPLGARLARVEVAPAPDLVRRVLAREHVRGPRRGWRGRALVLLAACVAAATALTAMTPGARSYVGELAAEMGLPGSTHDLAAVSGGGQTIRVTSGIDDGWIVILNIRAEPGTMAQDHPAIWAIGQLTATDASGAPLRSIGWQGNAADGGDEALAMFRRPPGGAAPGSPITLHVQPILESPTAEGRTAPGPGWTLHLRVPASPPPVPQRVPAGGQLGGVGVEFVDVRASDRYIVVVVDAAGPDGSATGSVAAASLAGPDGGHVSNMPSFDDPSGPVGVERQELYWPRHGSGTYHLTLGSSPGPVLERDLVIK